MGAQRERANWIGISQKADLTLHYCACASTHTRICTKAQTCLEMRKGGC